MIIVKLKGGLGNQLFQYAAGRHLAEIHKTILKIDISDFATYKVHAYSLSPFNIQENFASPEETMPQPVQKIKIIDRVIDLILGKSPKSIRTTTYIREKYFRFDADILNLPDDVYLDGYWQSEKYFTGIAGIISKEFSVKAPQVERNKDIAELIGSCDSVSLHIRRGTYLQPPYNSFHGICSLGYYYRCIDYLAPKLKNPHYFIFSDDPDWVSKNLQINYPVTFIDHNGAARDFEDLRLMTQCNHHVIANSTFSWWGAWLSKNPGKIVLSPKPWFRDPQVDTSDLIPDNWIKVDGID